MIYLIIKPRTKQDSYVATVSRLIQNRDPKSMLLEIQTKRLGYLPGFEIRYL